MVRLSLAAPASINGYFLPPLLQRLAEAGVDVSLRDAHSHEVVRHILEGTADAGFLLGTPSQPGIRRRLLSRDAILCVTGPSHPLAGREQLALRDLVEHPLALYSFSSDYDSLRDLLTAAKGSPLRGLVRITPAESARAMAMTGGFISFLPRMTIASDLESGRLVPLRVTGLPDFRWNISLVYRDRKEPAPGVQVLLKAVDRLWP